MLRRVLIANRGEIAVRIIRECRDASIGTVAVYSEADLNALHVMLADKAVCIGKSPSALSYLNMENIIEAARGTGCEAIHPGFGFLSENPEFAALCRENGLIFVGPPAQVIDKLGNKAEARKTMKAAGVPVVPGSDGPVETVEDAETIAEQIGYPVLIKASAGGGGRGMRVAENSGEVRRAFEDARLEAEKCFGDGTVYLEKLVRNPRHVEFQILADQYGNVIHLGERNCSIQRRNQKMIEEAPDWCLSEELRARMGADAVKAARAAGYRNAGTVEFIVDGDRYYFIEMNTRLQVEHPITEMITGVNLVREQLRIASGLPLEISQQDVRTRGHAIECRINAEDIFRNFAPSPGHVGFLHFPAGNHVRVESALYSGCDISPFYDSMAAKIIVYGDTRLEAIRRMRRALGETIIKGVRTTLPIQHLIMYHQDFLRGHYNTGFIENNLEELISIYEAAGGRNESIQ
ncbi:acetyl-CoA carboxylase biotin carboxylase subunit [Hornefia butyriciproducens]|uniref:acetyl-CoA carboxylase biotin carboxylase subunit n=1 Tax=Hornefia butyriciproducens TaxID=2652293 RepID=UPI003CFE1789